MRILFATLSFFFTVSLTVMYSGADSSGQGDCDGRALSHCFHALGDASDLTSSDRELDLFCGRLDRSRHCVDNFTRSCLTPPSSAFFYRLYGDTNRVLETVCGEELPRLEYASHAKCLERLERGLVKFSREFRHEMSGSPPADGNSKSDGRVCDAVRRFLRSAQELVVTQCEDGSAEYVRALLHKMSANVIRVCQYGDALDSAASTMHTHPTIVSGTMYVLHIVVTLQSEQVYNIV